MSAVHPTANNNPAPTVKSLIRIVDQVLLASHIVFIHIMLFVSCVHYFVVHVGLLSDACK
jgi:hypothetical protein